jgi:hypothetical protein
VAARVVLPHVLRRVGDGPYYILRDVRPGTDPLGPDNVLTFVFFRPLTGTGPTAGVALDEAEINTALDEYYPARQLGPADVGRPSHSP